MGANMSAIEPQIPPPPPVIPPPPVVPPPVVPPPVVPPPVVPPPVETPIEKPVEKAVEKPAPTSWILPTEQRCIACLNYHHHDHPSVLTEGANFQTYTYPTDSPRDKYVGIMFKGQPEWYGRLTFKSGAVYEGGFRAGEFNGNGHYIKDGKYEYIGGYSGGKKEGYGRESTVDAKGGPDVYVGGFKGDERHGEGTKNGNEWVTYYMGSQLPVLCR